MIWYVNKWPNWVINYNILNHTQHYFIIGPIILLLFLDFSNYEDKALATTKRLLLSTEEFSVFSKGISVELEIMDTTPHPSMTSMDHGERPKVQIKLIVIFAYFKNNL